MKFSLYEIFLAYKKAFKSRNKKSSSILFKLFLENNLIQIKNTLNNFNYSHSNYYNFYVYDSKKRLINSPTFSDHLLHHIIYNRLNLIYEKKFIYHSYANRIGKGSHRAVLKLFYKQKNKNFNYYLKMDISKYFAGIDHKIPYNIIKRDVYDKYSL